MAENSKIEWTHHTYNPWVGCTKVSKACDGCYAEGWAKRAGRHVWGPHADRQRTKTGANLARWNAAIQGTGRRERVFCASLADVMDNHRSIHQEWRDDFYRDIEVNQNLDFLLLTKRPQNAPRLLPDRWKDGLPSNVWFGVTAENQEEYDRRKPHLLAIPARVRFLSMEPLFTSVDLGDLTGIHWVIVGGMSGPGWFDAPLDWYRSIRDQCGAQNVAFLFKQYAGANQTVIKAKGRSLDGIIHDGYPRNEMVDAETV